MLKSGLRQLHEELLTSMRDYFGRAVARLVPSCHTRALRELGVAVIDMNLRHAPTMSLLRTACSTPSLRNFGHATPPATLAVDDRLRVMFPAMSFMFAVVTDLARRLLPESELEESR